MRRDIFGDAADNGKRSHGFSAVQIMSIALGFLSALAGLILIFKFKLITALIAMGVAEVLTTAIPTLAIIILIIYIWLKLKWHTMRRW